MNTAQYLRETLLRFQTCTYEEYSDSGSEEMCGKPAIVIMRYEDGGETLFWPACVEHMDPYDDVVTLSELVATLGVEDGT